jgi:hypothetical protein
MSPTAVMPTVVEVVARTLLLPYAELRVPGYPVEAFGERPVGAEVQSVPLVYSGRSVGELVVAVPPGGLGRRGHRLLEELARHTAVAAHATRLQGELHRSREHIVTSARRSADGCGTTCTTTSDPGSPPPRCSSTPPPTWWVPTPTGRRECFGGRRTTFAAACGCAADRRRPPASGAR